MTDENGGTLSKSGRWTKEEQNLFNLAFQWHGKDWKKLSEIISTRSIVQIRSHAQKYSKKIESRQSKESSTPKVYVIESALNDLNDYISSHCSNSYKKYLDFQQTLMYSQYPSISPYENKNCETSLKTELHHS
ncbi:hypothetical protein SteCoe_15187 [Stentor coeruleus]|uniref:HTH myb-type domain-containing protein n=1 Tax=Stentor coeruleus TaxID=5963 RepID=A0A1R2C4A5_9CILI|nr:hypothetical protein SteCoe_15187 [Stentor coeruleus]